MIRANKIINGVRYYNYQDKVLAVDPQLYRAHSSMIARTKRDPLYKGVVVCSEWLEDKRSFFKWSLDSGYRPGLSLDRLGDSNQTRAPYSPTTCRWATAREQAQNRRNHRHLEDGTPYYKALPELSSADYSRASCRLSRGKSLEQAVAEPKHHSNKGSVRHDNRIIRSYYKLNQSRAAVSYDTFLKRMYKVINHYDFTDLQAALLAPNNRPFSWLLVDTVKEAA